MHCTAYSIHWADGGETSLENLLLLCPRHHRVVHEGEVTMEVPDGPDGDASDPRFFRPDGRPLVPAPSAPPLGPDPLAELVATHREAGVEPDAWTPTPLWNGERFDLGFAISAFRGWQSPPTG